MFPAGFFWGASMSGFQFEMGGQGSVDPNTDWYVWVKNADNKHNGLVMGDNPEYSARYWDDWSRIHQLAQDAKMNMLRIGVEWSRIFPKPTFGLDGGALKASAHQPSLDRYKTILKDLKDRGMHTMVNLNHFTLPLWLHDPVAVNRGERKDRMGWLDHRSPDEFAKFAAVVVSELDPWVDYWSTLNEPNVVAQLGYNLLITGFPPAIIEPAYVETALDHESQAHLKAYDAMKPHTQKPVGIIYASGWATGSRKAQEAAMEAMTWRFMDRLKGKMDFIGLNYYSRIKVAEDPQLGWKSLPGFGQGGVANGFSPDGRPTSDFGWEIFPEGLCMVLKALHDRYACPLFVAENGIADHVDRYRPYYMISHLYAVEKALEMGADVRGYLHWSLTDNYEWAVGRSQRFGMVHLDFDSGILTPRPSYYLFREIVQRNTTEPWHQYLKNPYLLWDEENLKD